MTNETDHRRDETIEPVKPGFGAPERAHAPARRSTYRPPLAALLALVLAGLSFVVFFLLPRWVEQSASTAAAVPAAAVPATPAEQPAEPPLSEEELAALKEQAETQLTEILEQRTRLEARSVASWGGADWARYGELAAAGDDALLDDDYRAAVEHYTAALQGGAALLTRSARIIDAALATASDALNAGNAKLAQEQYELVLGIEPENAAAIEGNARARALPEVLALVQRAEQLRQEGSLADAAGLYREALATDPAWAPAQTALAEINATLANAEFEARLSRGFASLADEEYAEAQEHFRAALALRPDSRSAADGLAQSEQQQKLDAIALSEARALAFERRELWDEAIERYRAALETDPTLAFAIEGLARAQARVDLDRKLESLLGRPNLLFNDDVLADAARLADEARAFVEPGTRIAGQVARLDELVRLASTPIRVELRSDGLTEVTVYRVGRLGPFASKEIAVRPGTYTVVGSRIGYRDVRDTFTVLPGRAPPAVHIACTEPI